MGTISSRQHHLFCRGSIALLIVAYTDHIDLTVLSMIIPLLVICT